MYSGMRVLVFNADLGGCQTYRITIPFQELKRYRVQYVSTPELPNNPWGNDFSELCRFMSEFDLVIVQRCYKYPVVKYIKDACDFLGIKMIFETDDDYFNIPPSNPCYKELAPLEVKQGYAAILSMADAVTVSTQELADIVYTFNKNVYVLPNNVETLMCNQFGPIARGHSPEVAGPDGKLKLDMGREHGFCTIPDYYRDQKKPNKVLRIGYTGTPSHREDFETIRYGLEKVLKKYEGKVWVVIIGDRYFFDKIEGAKQRKIHIPISHYDLYKFHIRNVDIGLAPLKRDIFNMSKSPVKALEMGMWGIPCVLPWYTTYSREFTHEKNALMYYNQSEFADCLCELIENHALREKLGEGARDHVRDNRMECLHAEKRVDIYRRIINSTPKPQRFYGEKAC